MHKTPGGAEFNPPMIHTNARRYDVPNPTVLGLPAAEGRLLMVMRSGRRTARLGKGSQPLLQLLKAGRCLSPLIAGRRGYHPLRFMPPPRPLLLPPALSSLP